MLDMVVHRWASCACSTWGHAASELGGMSYRLHLLNSKDNRLLPSPGFSQRWLVTADQSVHSRARLLIVETGTGLSW